MEGFRILFLGVPSQIQILHCCLCGRYIISVSWDTWQSWNQSFHLVHPGLQSW